jgi:K+-transporting ATPase KdpF subunit
MGAFESIGALLALGLLVYLLVALLAPEKLS